MYSYLTHLKRQPRIHTCFSYCINGEDPNVIGETRVNCVDLPPSERDKIICLYPEELCEQTTLPNEFGTADGSAAISPEIAIYAMLIVVPLQFIFEFLCVVLVKLKSKEFLMITLNIVIDHHSTWESMRVLLLQIFLTAIFVYIVAESIYFINIIATNGRPGLVFLTLLLSLAFDQIKSVGFLYIIYVVIVRRFMHLSVNENEYVKPEVLSLPV